jgi:hypothetical protein
MEKKSIFKKIDELYTKVTKVIIGDVPHDGETQHTSSKSTPHQNQETNIQSTLLTVKEKILNLGKPNDEKALLYQEVVKREKQESKEADKQAKASKKATKSKTTKTDTNKKITSTKTKKPVTKKVSENKASSTKTKTSKKTPAKKTQATAESKTTQTKKTTTKKPAVKKSIAKSSTAKKPTTTKSTTKTSTKTAESKKTTVTKKPVAKKSVTKKPVAKKTTPKTTSTKKATTSKTTPTKKAPTSKKAAASKGSKRDAKIALYIKDIKKHYGEVDEDFVAIVVKNLGPSIYKKDAEFVSCSDPKELDTVRKNFLVKKLGIDASKGVLDAAIQDVCTELKGVRTKYRATFYYALAKKFKKESVLS